MACKGGYLLELNESCTYKEGPLPSCAPLAVGTIPMQTSAEPVYNREEALEKGTLFPGLDLPFMDYVATGMMESGPKAELMALDFVAHELALYLDTHPDDAEAFETWKSFIALAEEGRRRYVDLYGPVTKGDTAQFDSWKWACCPWPWEYTKNGGNG